MQEKGMDNMNDQARAKQRLIEKFLQLTEGQAEAIRSDKFDSILNTINKKQHIIEHINMLELNGTGNQAGENESLQTINENIKEMMARAIAIDDANIEALRNRQAEIFEKLRNAQKNKTTHALYRGKNTNIGGILLNQKK